MKLSLTLSSLCCADPWPAPLQFQAGAFHNLSTSGKAAVEHRGQRLSGLQLASHLLVDTTAIMSNSKINSFYLILSK